MMFGFGCFDFKYVMGMLLYDLMMCSIELYGIEVIFCVWKFFVDCD